MDNLTRIIKLQLQDTVLHASSTLAGYEGDHCATQLQLDIPPRIGVRGLYISIKHIFRRYNVARVTAV